MSVVVTGADVGVFSLHGGLEAETDKERMRGGEEKDREREGGSNSGRKAGR